LDLERDLLLFLWCFVANTFCHSRFLGAYPVQLAVRSSQSDVSPKSAASGTNLRVREIVESDLPAVAALLTKGFAFRSNEYWRRGLARHARRARPAGYPTYGYCLDHQGVPVGVILLLFSEVCAGAQTIVRCNVSSWYVEPQFRTFGSMMVKAATRDKAVTYFNITPAPHTWASVEAQGFSVYCKGQMYGALALSWPVRGATAAVFSEDRVDGLTPFEVDLLGQHASFGCLSVVVRDGGKAFPFVFQKHHVKGIVPVFRLIYCRDVADVQIFAGNIGRLLARRGGVLVRFDANGPAKGIVGWYSEDRGRKYVKGPCPPHLGDLAYTEAVIFDS
jgi:hypothetical protein